MTRRRDDVSDLPAACRGKDDHTHPLPAHFRLMLAGYGVLLLLALGGLGASIVLERQTSRAADERQGMAIDAELDRRTAERTAEDARLAADLAAQKAVVDRAICLVLDDLPPRPSVTALARELGCPALT